MRGPTSRGHGEPCPAGGHYLNSGTPTMRCHTAWGQWEVELLHCIATVPEGSGQWNSCNALPHFLGQWNSCNALPHRPKAVGSGTLAMHCHTAWGAMGSATVAMHCPTAEGAVGSGTLAMHSAPEGSGQCNSSNAVPHCPGAGGRATPVMHYHSACGQWAVELLLCSPTMLGGIAQCNSCTALPQRHGTVGNGTLAMRARQLGGRGFRPRRRSLPK